MICIYTGLPGSGKSLRMAQTLMSILHRNYRWYKKSGKKRIVYSNLKLAPEIEERYKDLIAYWGDPEQLVKVRDADIFWDEVATHLDSTQWQNVPLELKRFLQQHRKYGIEIYGTTQDFSQIDISMRRLTSDLYYLQKLCGSRDKSATRPDVKFPWGLILMRTLDPQNYKEDEKLNKASGWWFMFITTALVNAYDTRQEIKMGSYPPLKHIERHCINERCGHVKLVHV